MQESDKLTGFFKGLSDMVSDVQVPRSEWWRSFTFSDVPNFSVHNLINYARSALFAQAMAGGQTVRECTFVDSVVNSSEAITRADNYVNDLGGRLVYTWENTNKKLAERFYIFDGGAIRVVLSESSGMCFTCTVQIIGTTTAHMQVGKDLLKEVVHLVKVEAK